MAHHSYATMSILKVSGTQIVDGEGKEVLLRGCGIGGWMNMENFITGFPGREYQIREALAEVLGEDKAKFFFDKFLEYFFTEADAKFYKSLGLNCIRVPFNYRHFEDDMNPRVLKPEGFKWLDRVVNLCAEQGIYTILDLHTVPGGHNGDWHSDSGHHLAEFWRHKDFQDRGIWLWQQLAEHYKGNPWIAGYNPLNEPCDPTHSRLQAWYHQLYAAVRAIDPDHILFLDGNTFASDFSHFDVETTCKVWTNTVYSVHDYSTYGFPLSRETYTGTDEQRARIKRGYERKVAWMKANNLPIWNGEWGPVYARRQYDGDKTDDINRSRIQLLKDQLEVYDEDNISWSIWLYKDIGYQGMVYVDPATPYMKLFEKFLHKKWVTAVDAWGADEAHVKEVWDPLEAWVAQHVPEKYRNLYPHPVWKFESRISRLSRNILLAEYMVREWADHFEGMDYDRLDEIAQSFRFENCLLRGELNKALVEHKGLGAK
ncbi:glycoside hydrolase superfamily [Geopyxis carbonaria]|nr:glycoside hydrolase superfamily [Geopyxis carbonaria]